MAFPIRLEKIAGEKGIQAGSSINNCPFMYSDECNREAIDLHLCTGNYAQCITYKSLNKIGLTAKNI